MDPATSAMCIMTGLKVLHHGWHEAAKALNAGRLAHNNPLHACTCSGRKKAALAYVLTYTTGCVTKHFNNFNVLLVGRLFCGVATSLLNSVFESWLVAEHRKVCLGRSAGFTSTCHSPAVCTFIAGGSLACTTSMC